MLSSRAHLSLHRITRPRRCPPQRVPVCSEALEHRTLLTGTLYLDYGDNWPGGVLNTTAGDIDDTTNGSNPNIDGPLLSDAAGDDYDDDDPVVITSINNLYSSSAATALRSTMNALTQRFYEPFDINVVDLVGSAGAANLNGVSTILGQLGTHDTYLLIGRFIINGTDNPATFASNGYGGLSTGTDSGGDNDNDGTALVLLIGTNDSATFNGPQNAHEAGHAFGLEHVYRQGGSPISAALDLLHQSELMSYLGYNTQGGFNFFSRFPVTEGDGNTDPDDLVDEPTPYDNLAQDPNIGPSGIEYVTGTGAHDIITITRTGATTAHVTLQAFSDAARTNAIDFPGGTGTTYEYDINTDRPLTIDAGGSNDRIVIDADLGNTITLRGMHGTDELVVNGKGAANAVYTTGTNNTNGLDGNSDLRGSVQIGSTTINFQEFETASRVTVQNVGTLTVRTGGSNDTITDDTPGTVEGTSGGVTMVGLTYTGVTHLVIDTGANDGGSPNDNVTLDAAPVAGLSTIAVNTGAGADTLTLDFNPSNPVPSGPSGLSFDGGTADGGEDLLVLRDGTFATETYTATGPSSGTIALSGGTDITYSNLSPIDDSLNVADMTFNARPVADEIAIENGTISGFTAGRIRSANGTFELLDFANKTNVVVNGLGEADTFDLVATSRPTGLASLTLNGGAGADTVNVTRTVSPVSYVVNGDGGNDRVNVTGAGLAAGSTVQLNGNDDADTFNVTSSADVAIPVNGGGGSDTLKVNGQTLTYAFQTVAGTTSFTTAGRQPVTSVLVELLDVRNGTFTVLDATTVDPNVRVQGVEDGPATLNGTGTIGGTLTADSGGTVSPAVGAGVTGVLTSGSATLNAGSTFFVDLNGIATGTGHDQLHVAPGTATVTINNATLAGTLGAAYDSVPGDELVIIRNDGSDAVVGKFAQGDMIEIGGKKFAIDYAFDGDNDGNLNDVALIRYGAELHPDPCDPSKMALFVSATTGADNVLALPVTGSARVRIVIEAITQGFTDHFGPFDFDGQIIMMGQSGDDRVTTAAVPSRNVMLYGNVGKDTVIGGNNGGILLGNLGDDTLVGGNSRELLIGGAGADNLAGNNAGDILVGGATVYDTNTVAHRQALCEILHEWEHGGRRSSLLNDAAAVIDDVEADVLNGGLGVDWFIGKQSEITDLVKSEVVSNL